MCFASMCLLQSLLDFEECPQSKHCQRLAPLAWSWVLCSLALIINRRSRGGGHYSWEARFDGFVAGVSSMRAHFYRLCYRGDRWTEAAGQCGAPPCASWCPPCHVPTCKGSLGSRTPCAPPRQNSQTLYPQNPLKRAMWRSANYTRAAQRNWRNGMLWLVDPSFCIAFSIK